MHAPSTCEQSVQLYLEFYTEENWNITLNNTTKKQKHQSLQAI